MSDDPNIVASESQRLLPDEPVARYGIDPTPEAAQVADLGAPVVYDDENAVDFDEGDPENPRNWPTWYKWVIMALLTLMFVVDIIATMSIMPAVPQLLEEFGETNPIYMPLVVSIWELGEGVGPFIVAPMSEMYGRLPIYHVGNLFFMLFSALSATSTNIRMLVAMRFLTGLSIPVLTTHPAVIGDLFIPEERGFAMAVCMFAGMLGSCGPLAGGWIAEHWGWRWTIWIIVIAIGVLEVLSLLILPETYKITILRRKAKRLREETGNKELHSKYEIADQKNLFKRNFLRPLKMLFLEPVVCFISWYSAITYGLGYLVGAMIVITYEKVYHFSPSETGMIFIIEIVFLVAATLIYGAASDRYLKYREKKDGVLKPESRLVFFVIGALITPIGFFFYGWAIQFRWHWIIPVIAWSVSGFGGSFINAGQQGYMIDAYDTYSASAMAASVISKAVLGAVIPLAGPALNGGLLDYGWGNSVIGLVVLAFVPFCVLLIKYGERIRKSRAGKIKW